MSNNYFGRRRIISDATDVTDKNVLEILNKALVKHSGNRAEIQYLWDYYRGNQPVLTREKEIRSDICNRIVENRANEIVSFKVGYLCGEPIQYVSRNGKDDTVAAINALNEMMFSEDKASQDQEIVEWQMICGTAFRAVLPDATGEEDNAPFEMHTLDPRDTFVVYSNEIGRKPLMGVKYCINENDTSRVYTVYSPNHYWKIEENNIIESKPHALGMIPIFEYPANNARLGAFEIVLPLLDAINNVASNRMDGLEQFVQAFWKFVGCKLDHEQFKEFLDEGAICIPPNDTGGNIDVDLVTKELNQDQVQTMVNHMYQTILTICGMPNRNGGSSTSDTGSAVLLRDGWSLAEARAKDSENIFKRSEKQMLKLVLRICRDLTDLKLNLQEIDMRFTRRNYDNIQSKSQVLVSMLHEPKIHPLLAFSSSGLFSDSESAYSMSMKYYDEQRETYQIPPQTQTGQEQVNSDLNGQIDNDVREDAQ